MNLRSATHRRAAQTRGATQEPAAEDKMNHSGLAIGLLVPFLLTAVSAQEEETELYFPNVVSLWLRNGVFEDIFMLYNHGDDEVQAILRIYTDEGLLDSENVFNIPGGKLESLSYFVFPFQFFLPQVQGWGALTLPTGSAVKAHHRLSVRDRLFQAFASVTTEAVPLGSVFRVILPNVKVEDLHSISIVNPSPEETAKVRIEFDRHGTGEGNIRRCDQSMSIAPMHRMSRFIEHEVCEKDTSGAGWPPGQMEMIFSSDLPIAFSAMEFFPDTGGFAALPVQKLED